MSALPIREEAIAYLNELSDAQIAIVLEFMKSVQSQEAQAAVEYDQAADPLAGFFEGPPDLARSSKDILRKEYGLRKPQESSIE